MQGFVGFFFPATVVSDRLQHTLILDIKTFSSNQRFHKSLSAFI